MKLKYHVEYLRTDSEFIEKYEYWFLQIANAVGSFIARSNTNMVIMSVPMSMSLLQTLNLLFIIFNMNYLGWDSFEFMFIFMLYSGYLGGSIYLNTFYIITAKKRKENRSSIEPVPFEN